MLYGKFSSNRTVGIHPGRRGSHQGAARGQAGLGDPDDEQLELLEILVVDRQVHTEAVPQPFVAVLEVGFEVVAEVGGQTHVVQLVTLVEGVHPVSAAHDVADDVRVRLQGGAGKVLDVLAHERVAAAGYGFLLDKAMESACYLTLSGGGKPGAMVHHEVWVAVVS